LVFALGWELSKNEIIKAVIKEFTARSLDVKYVKEIEEWKKYKSEKIFTKKLDENMKDEIKRFEENIKEWTPKELEEIIWDISD